MVLRNGKSPEHLGREKKKPLQELLNKNHWVRGELQREAFQIKQALVSSPFLTLFDPNCETVVSADASSQRIGAVLLQKQQEKLKPIVYISRSSLLLSNIMLKYRRKLLHSLGHVNDSQIIFSDLV